MGYTPLQLVTGKSCNLPGLTVGNEATVSISEIEAVQKVIERIMELQEEFRKAEIRTKLKDCQGVQVRGYQHQKKYLEGVRCGCGHKIQTLD